MFKHQTFGGLRENRENLQVISKGILASNNLDKKKALFLSMHYDLVKLITFLFNPLIIWFSFRRKPGVSSSFVLRH